MALHARLTREIRGGASGPKVGAFFDVDRTLLAGFSAIAFFRGRFVSGQMSPSELSQGLLGALSYGLGRTGFSGFVSATTAAYRGLAEEVLEQLGQEVFERHLATEIYPESRALVKAHRERGHTVALVSSATAYQVDPVARDLEVEHVMCTRLEVEDGVFTGRVLKPTCFGDGKMQAAQSLAESHDLDLGQSYLYTDSVDDLPLLVQTNETSPADHFPIGVNRAWIKIQKPKKRLI